jgi:hypothetical protein
MRLSATVISVLDSIGLCAPIGSKLTLLFCSYNLSKVMNQSSSNKLEQIIR